jgi:hypothetical protein
LYVLIVHVGCFTQYSEKAIRGFLFLTLIRFAGTFYYNIISEQSTWTKPEEVLLRDKGVRGWNLIHKYAGTPIQLHCQRLWAEHADAKTGAIYYR